MDINNPLFLIPEGQVKPSGKGGGRSVVYYGDRSKFEGHKRERVKELDTVLQSVKRQSEIEAPDGRMFFELEFDKQATSKSSQPKVLLSAYNIDIESQLSDRKFIATTTESNLSSFRDSVSKISANSKYEAPYLSAITKIENISVKQKINQESIEDTQLGFIYLHNSLSNEDGQKVFASIKNHMESSLDLEYFVSPSGSKVIYGSYSRDELGDLIDESPRNPIMKFEQSQFFVVPQSIESQYVMNDTEVVLPDTDAVVGILDTGIAKHPVFKNLVIGGKDYEVGRSEDEVRHGSLVGSRAIFGNNIEDTLDSENTLYAQVKVMDFRVLRNDDVKSDKQLIDHIVDILDTHAKTVKVYNLSANQSIGVHSLPKRSYMTEQLDALAYKHRVIFIVSAGNQSLYLKREGDFDYPDTILIEAATIAAPADGANVIAVGSIADSESSRSLAKNNEPSPFTRHGQEGSWKPELVHYGGNVDKKGYASGIGIKGLSSEINHVAENAGTSFAAPLVSQVAAQIYSYVMSSGKWKFAPVDLAKALLLHSSAYELPSDSVIEQDQIRQLVGFGIPDYGRALDTSKNAATFVSTGTIGVLEKKVVKEKDKEYKAAIQKIEFTVPPEMKAKGKKIKIRGTLVYTSPLNPNGGLDYVESDIEVNLHHRNSRGKLVSGGLTTEKENDNRTKWNPIKCFEKTYSAYDGGMWEVWLIANNRGGAESSGLTQDYALVITIEDVSGDFENRLDVHNLIKTQHRQYIQLQPQVKVKQSIR